MKKKVELNLLYLIKNNEILLGLKKRGFGEGRFNGIGGKAEKGESIEACMVREAQEEIGITPTKFEKVADIVFDEYFKGEPTLMHVHIFFADEWQGEPVESEEIKPKWFKKDKLPYDQMWPNDTFWMPQVIRGEKVIAKFVLDEKDQVISHKIVIVDKL